MLILCYWASSFHMTKNSEIRVTMVLDHQFWFCKVGNRNRTGFRWFRFRNRWFSSCSYWMKKKYCTRIGNHVIKPFWNRQFWFQFPGIGIEPHGLGSGSFRRSELNRWPHLVLVPVWTQPWSPLLWEWLFIILYDAVDKTFYSLFNVIILLYIFFSQFWLLKS